MIDAAFGQYFPSNSIIHKLDARIKMIITTIFMVAAFIVNSYISYIILFLFTILISFISKVPLRKVLKSIKSLLFIIIFAGTVNIFFNKNGYQYFSWKFISITTTGIDIAIKTAVRLIIIVIETALLTLTTTPNELTDGIESLLKPLKLIKIPVHDIAIIMALALRFVPGFIEEADKIIMAQKSRGANFDSKNLIKKAKSYLPVLIPLFVSAFQKADQLADALDSRCYNATKNRTKYKKMQLHLRDFIAFFIIILLLVFILLDNSTFHLHKYLEGNATNFFIELHKGNIKIF